MQSRLDCLLLGAAALGQVMRDAHDLVHCALRIEQGHAGDGEVAYPGRQCHVDLYRLHDPVLERRMHCRLPRGDQFFREDVIFALSEEGFRRHAGRLHGGRVDVLDSQLAVINHHHVRHVVEGGAKARLTGGQRLLGPLLVIDVLDYRHEMAGLTRRVARQRD